MEERESRGEDGRGRGRASPGPQGVPPPAGPILVNSSVETGSYPDRLRRILSLEAHETAFEEMSSWPGYRPTPLVSLPGLADRAGVASLRYKDEGFRFGLGSFKALGGAYAVLHVLRARIRAATPAGEARSRLTSERLRAGAFREIVSRVTVSCASAGNHGRSVAWGAEIFGCECVVYLPRGASLAREEAIRGHGARVVRVDGDYERALDRASRDAREEGRIVVSDTAYDGHTDLPRVVMQGYTVLVREALARLAPESRPTHLFLQGGVGGFAAAVTAHLWDALGPDRPRVTVVEPAGADCLRRSLREGRRVELEHAPESAMDGLACRAPSRLAWPVLHRGAHAFMAVTEEACFATMRILAAGERGEPGDPAVVPGPSGAAGLAGLLSATRRPEAREALGLGPDSRVLVVGTEGAPTGSGG